MFRALGIGQDLVDLGLLQSVWVISHDVDRSTGRSGAEELATS